MAQPEGKKGLDAKTPLPQFNIPDLTTLNAPMTELLVSCGQERSNVVKAVNDMREELAKYSYWVSNRIYEWAMIYISQNPDYPRICSILKNDKSAQFLDLGCYLSVEGRQLIHDGVDSKQMTGIDIDETFFEKSYQLFKDRDTNAMRFYKVDILKSEAIPKDCLGKCDVIWTARFFHIWGWDEAMIAAVNTVKLLKPKPGAIIFGTQQGHPHGIEIPAGTRKMFLHNHETWLKFWAEVGQKTGTAWKTQTWYSPLFNDIVKSLNKDMLILVFTLERIDGPAGHVEDLGNSNIVLHGKPEGP